MTLENLPKEPNVPIFLESISITHINGHLLQGPCTARIKQQLSPMATLLESDNFPVGIMDPSLAQPFVVTIQGKGDVKVVRSRLRLPALPGAQ